MSARSSPGVGRRSLPAPKRDGQSGSVAGGAAAGAGGMEGQRLVGRKILKPLGDTGTVVHGHVKDYNPPVNGREETWTVQFENLQGSDNGDGDGGGSGSDGGSVREEAVRRPELDKWLNLQSVKEREFPASAAKRGRGRPKKNAAVATPERLVSTPPKSSKRSPAAAAAKGKSKLKNKKKKQPPSALSSASASASLGSSASSSADPVPVPKKKKKRVASKSQEEEDDDAGKLRGNSADLGKQVAKEFAAGVFVGEVVDVRRVGAKGTLWKVEYEDSDQEDLDEVEMETCMHMYKLLSDSFAKATGRSVSKADLANEDRGEGEEEEESASQSTPKRKGKAKRAARVSAQEKLVGVGVRKFFPRYKEEFDGEVVEYFPPESDDEYGDLWLIKYEDGDSEHFNEEELREARASYDKRYALWRKAVAFPNARFAEHKVTNLSKESKEVILYGESPAESTGVFCTIKGYRRYKKKAREA